jgi:hypothetical protein
VSKRLIVPGAVATPPDSSDDDEDRGRHVGNLRELQKALQQIDVKRQHSPNRDGASDSKVEPKAEATSSSIPVEPLSAEARKMSHARSSSDMTLSRHASQLNLDTHPIQTSSSENSDVEDDELRIKPPLLRKKSGELVKPALRPATRRRPSSMPGTPTFAKAVHFNENMEQVRHFLQVDRPMAVSAGSSPVETWENDSDYPWGYDDGYRSSNIEWEIKLPNFPSDTYERKSASVRVERIFLASDRKNLIGTVAVANISFHKVVVARFTLDYWKTTSEVVAEYNHDVRKKQANDGYDRFNFNIKLTDLANLESKTMFVCVRYQVSGQEFWDNNNSMNYQVDFVKKVKAKNNPGSGRPAIPRSRQSAPGPRPRSLPVGSLDDDFDQDLGSRFEFGSPRITLGDPPNSSIRLKPKSKRGGFFPDQAPRRNPNGQAFSSRYDFGASLTAALSTAQKALGDRSGIKPVGSRPTAQNQMTAGGVSVSSAAPVPGLSSDKPGLQSEEYNELIKKFCFVRSPNPKGPSHGSTDH